MMDSLEIMNALWILFHCCKIQHFNGQTNKHDFTNLNCFAILSDSVGLIQQNP